MARDELDAPCIPAHAAAATESATPPAPVSMQARTLVYCRTRSAPGIGWLTGQKSHVSRPAVMTRAAAAAMSACPRKIPACFTRLSLRLR